MSGTRYHDADTIAEAQEYLRNGGDEERAAAFLQCTVEELPRLIGQPQWKPIPAKHDDTAFDLFATDRLDGVL